MLARMGNCNNCGICCLREGGLMVENPCIELGQDRCLFYTDTENSDLYGHCLIHGRGAKPTKAVRDRFGNKITDAQIKWFNDNCIDYPLAGDIQSGLCPSECSFEVIDG